MIDATTCERDSAAPGADEGAVGRLMLTRFRSYGQAVLDFGAAPPRIVVLHGPNGAGKTNLLEALSVLAPGRGLRRATIAEMTNRESVDGWAVAARLTGRDGGHDIGTGLKPAANDNGEAPSRPRRLVRIDGEAASGPAALGELLSVIWLTPQMDRLFLDGPQSRRRFLDRLVAGLHGHHARALAAYERAMRERNRLLESQGAVADPAWLGALERRMAEHGVAVAAARIEAVSELSHHSAEEPGAFPRFSLEASGSLEAALATGSALAVEDEFATQLAEARAQDRETGRARLGPHASDLAVTFADKDMPAAQCSTGEQKAILAGIVLASARLARAHHGRPVLLLMDEVAAHLDDQRRAALFEAIAELKAQTWLTGTDRAAFAALAGQARFLAVADSHITAETDA